MKRLTLIKIHLYLSGVVLMFLSLMALSGSLHLFLGDETEKVEEVAKIVVTEKLSKTELTSFFAKQLEALDSSYTYDYIKGSAQSQMSRPTTRSFYTIKTDSNFYTIERHDPSVLKSLMELHKGHGPKASRLILGILGLIVIGSLLSGLWLGISSKPYRKITIVTAATGIILYLLLFFL